MKKLILCLVLIFFISLSAKRIHAYSIDSSTPYLTSENTHILVSQDMETKDGKYLVPTGAILGINDVEEIVFTYKIFVQKNVEVNYYIKNIVINSELASSEISNIFNFEFEEKSIEFDSLQTSVFDKEVKGEYIEITLIMSMNFPTAEQISSIAGKQISFEISFESGE